MNTKLIRRALYAGTFDPPSCGHLDIINRALKICDHLTIGIGHNPMKKPIFDIDERKQLLKKITNNTDRIKIVKIEGLVAGYIANEKIDFQVRGIRSFADFDTEFTMGLINRELCEKETVFLLSSQ